MANDNNKRITIDLITHNPNINEYALIIVETRPWDGSEGRLLELQNKLNDYLEFVQGGHLKKLYPKSIGNSIRIQLDSVYGLDGTTKEFLEKAENILLDEGVKFCFNRLKTSIKK